MVDRGKKKQRSGFNVDVDPFNDDLTLFNVTEYYDVPIDAC